MRYFSLRRVRPRAKRTFEKALDQIRLANQRIRVLASRSRTSATSKLRAFLRITSDGLSRLTKNLWDTLFRKGSLATYPFLLYFFVASLLFDLVRPTVLYLYKHSESDLSSMWPLILQINTICLLLGIAVKIVVKNRYYLLPLIGGPFGLVGYLNVTLLSVSIITVAWHGAIGFFASLSLFFRAMTLDIEVTTRRGRTHFSSEKIRDDIWSIIKLIAQTFLTFSVITGVCMTILFGPGYDNLSAKANAIQMISGFGFCALSLYIWGLCPSLRIFSEINKESGGV